MQWEGCSQWTWAGQGQSSTRRAGRCGSLSTAALVGLAVGAQSLRRAGTAEEGGRFLKLHSLLRLVTRRKTGTEVWHGGRWLRPLPPRHFERRGMQWS